MALARLKQAFLEQPREPHRTADALEMVLRRVGSD